ncbi:MAG: hypothetical protein GTO02_21485, partial [Candidatus Dadabacteria bacterium]|nr:hypothetical protein [Candidatus Dadabacteria bacterium]
NYAKNALDGLVNVGRWTVSDGIKGLILDNSSGGNVTKKFYSPTTSDEARTVSVAAGSGILNLSANTTNDIKTAFVSFPQTDIIVPSNSVGRIRVDSSGIVSFSALTGVNTARFFVLAEVATDTDSLLFIDNKKFVSTNHHNNVYSNNLDIGTYFIEGSAQPIEQNITPLKLNSSYIFPYTFNGIKYTGNSKNEINFWRFYRDTGETLGYKQLAQTLFIDNQYDNGTNSLVVVPDGFYKKDLFYYVQTDEQLGENYKFMLIYSTAIYPTLKEAELSPNPPVPSFFTSGSVQLCSLITSVNNSGATVVLETIQDARKFINPTIPYASMDDHTQYLLLDGSRSMTSNLDMNNNDIVNCNDIKTDNLTSSTTTEIKLNNDLDFQNIYKLLNIEDINGIRPSGGLYSESSLTSFNQTTETNMLGISNFAGTLTVPANTFKLLSVYSLKCSGVLTGGSNDLFTLRLKSGSVIFAALPIQLTDNGLVDNWWDLTADFQLNTLGAAGIAVLVTSVVFRYINNTNVVSTRAVNNIENTNFDTTISNTLSFTFQNDVTNPLTSLQMRCASFTQWY